MSWRWRPLQVAAVLFHAFVTLGAGQIACATRSPVSIPIPNSSPEFLITVSADCVVRVIRQSDLAQLHKHRVDGCSPSGIARADDGRTLFIPSGQGLLTVLALPDLTARTWGAIGSATTSLVAVASDHYLFAIDPVAGQLQVFDLNTHSVLRTLQFRDRLGHGLTFSRMEEAKARRSMIIAFRETELWEIFLAPDAAPVFEGLVHDYRMGEAIAETSTLPLRRIVLDRPITFFYLEPHGAHLMFCQHDQDGNPSLQRLNLDVRRVVAKVNLAVPANALAVTPARDGNMRVLLADRLGMQVFHPPSLTFEGRVQLTGDGCKIATAPTANWIALLRCRGKNAGRIIVVDADTLAIKAQLEPFGAGEVSDILVNQSGTKMWAVSRGSAGKLVGFVSSGWVREHEINVPHLSRAWDYR